MKPFRKRLMEPLEHLLELGGIRKDITLLVLSGIAVVLSLAGVQPLPFDIAWAAIILCGVPIILEAIIGLVTEFDIKADVPVPPTPLRASWASGKCVRTACRRISCAASTSSSRRANRCA